MRALPFSKGFMAKKYEVKFSGITDAKGELRLKGEVLEAGEIADVQRQVELGAIGEVGKADAAPSDDTNPQPSPADNKSKK